MLHHYKKITQSFKKRCSPIFQTYLIVSFEESSIQGCRPKFEISADMVKPLFGYTCSTQFCTLQLPMLLCMENLKALSVILNSKGSLFSEPPDCFAYSLIQRELDKLPIQQFSWKQHIFENGDNSLLFGMNFCKRKLIQVSVSSNKSFKFWFP